MAAATTPGPVLQQDLQQKFDQLTALLENFSSSPGPGDTAIKELVDLKTKEKDQQIERLKKDQIAVNRQATHLAANNQKKYDKLKRKLNKYETNYKTKTIIQLKNLADLKKQNKKKIKDKEKEIKGRKSAQKAMASLFKQRIDKFKAEIKKLKSELQTAKDHALVTFDDDWKQNVKNSTKFPEVKALKKEADEAKKIATKAEEEADKAVKEATEKLKAIAKEKIQSRKNVKNKRFKNKRMKDTHEQILKVTKQLLIEAEEEFANNEETLKELDRRMGNLEEQIHVDELELKNANKKGLGQQAKERIKTKIANKEAQVLEAKAQKERLLDSKKLDMLRQEARLLESYGRMSEGDQKLLSEMEDFLKEVGEIKDEKEEAPKKGDTNPSTTTSILGGLKTGAKAVGAAGVLGAGAYGLTKMFGTPAQQKKADEIKDTIVNKISKATDPVTRRFSSNPPPAQSILNEPRIHNECAY